MIRDHRDLSPLVAASMDVQHQRRRGFACVPWFLAACALAAMASWLLAAYRLAPYSDPGLWYACGRDFADTFAHSKRAYGFPLVVHAAILLIGPYPAFLINVPILLLLALVVALFARRLALGRGNGAAATGWLAAAAALLLFVVVNSSMLPHLVNPYRDPLSFLLMLTAGLLLVRFRQEPARHRWDPAWAGAALALAVSTRETSILLLPALFLYAVMSRREQRDLPFARPLLLFVAAFAVAAIPYAVQNYLVTGNPMVPAQAAKSQTFKGHLVPGVQLDFLAGTLPACLRLLRDHYGLAALLAAAGGLAAAVCRAWRAAILGLLAPAIAIYLLFYGSYVYPVHRYLFVLDLFVVPLGALAIATAAEAVQRRTDRAGWRIPLVPAIAVLLTLATITVALSRAAGARPAFALADMRRLAADVAAAMPRDAVLVGDRPLGEFFRSFGLHDARVIDFLTPQVSLRHPGVGPALSRLAAQHPGVFLLNRRPLARRIALREFDLAETARFPSDAYRLRAVLDTPDFTLERLVPWTALGVTSRVDLAQSGGPTLLEVRTGRLSKHPRTYARLWVGSTLVTELLPDYDSFHLVDLPRGSHPLEARVESDAPLCSLLDVRAQSAAARIDLDFGGDEVIEHPTRLSEDFFARPRMARDPFITRGGSLRLPTPAPGNSAFLFSVQGRIALIRGSEPLSVALALDGRPMASRSWPLDRDAMRLHLSVPPAAVTQDEVRMDLAFAGKASATFLVESATVLRAPATGSLRIVLGESGDERYLVHGFHRPERGSDPGLPAWRWTAPQAAIWLPLLPDDRPVALRLRYRPGPAEVSGGSAPRIFLGGRELHGTVGPAEGADGKVREFSATIPAPEWPADQPVLDVVSDGWVPAEHGASRDHRRIGTMLFSVEARRL